MAKRVRVNIPGVRVNETDCQVLRVIADHAVAQSGFRCAPVSVSRRELHEGVGKSEQTIIRSCKALSDEGLLIITSNIMDNGAQVANTYEITALGLEVIRLADILALYMD